MRALILTPVYSEKGGGALTVRKLASHMVRSGVQVCVVTTEKERASYTPDGTDIRFLRHRMLFGTEYISPLEVHSIVREFRPDIIHGSGPSIICDLGFLSSRLLGIPMLLTYHADLNLEKPLSRAYTKVSDTLVLRNMEGVAVTTDRYARILEERGIRRERIAVVPLGCDCSRFRRAGGPSSKNNVLFVGGLGSRNAYKRADLLIRAFALVKAKIDDATLTLVGRGEFVEEYRKLADSLGIGGSVSILTDVDDEALPRFYEDASVFVLPSPDCQEGFGIVLLEAMAAGVPVITSEACGGAPAVREGGSGLLYTPYDIEDLAGKIGLLLTDRALAAELGAHGTALAEQYDWARSAQKQISMYERVLAERNR